MIVVTGLRSGTSMTMQTLKLLGFPVVGLMFHDDFSHQELNLKGYYDLPVSETINGLNTTRYKGKAVKLGGYQLSATNPRYVSKVIICQRERDTTIKSIVKFLKAEFDISNVEPTEKNAILILDTTNDLIEKCGVKKPHMRIQYEVMVRDPERCIEGVCQFLNIQADIKKAVNNIEKREACLY